MDSNRAQRRAAYKKGKRPGETYADQLAREKDIKQAIEKAARDETVALETDIKTQRFLWMAVVANHMAFGHAGVRAQRFMMTLNEVREDMEKMAAKNGWEYAVEKLREQCEKITGMEVKQVHEEAMIRARKENEAKGIFFDAEDPEDLAAIGFTGARDTGPKWISVKERKPDKEWLEFGEETGRILEVIVMIQDAQQPTTLFYDGHDGFFNYGFDEEKIYYAVTHWMPLPEGPEEDKKWKRSLRCLNVSLKDTT